MREDLRSESDLQLFVRLGKSPVHWIRSHSSQARLLPEKNFGNAELPK
jgi:hypothetical protein